MPNFLRPDNLQFWLIILTISIVWWLRDMWGPLFNKIFNSATKKLSESTNSNSSPIEFAYRTAIFQQAQESHLTGKLFPLSEIAVPPHYQVPTPDYDPDNPIAHLPLSNEIIPYLPDMPGLGAYFNSPTQSILQPLSLGLDIGLIGKSGSGKTFTLNWLAIEFAQKKPSLGDLSDILPILFHASDLANSKSQNPAKSIANIWNKKYPELNNKEINQLFDDNLSSGNVIFLIDGLDEISTDKSENLMKFFKTLQELYPNNQYVFALSPFNQSPLEHLNLYPFALAYWNEENKTALFDNWYQSWKNSSNAAAITKHNQPEFISRKLLLEATKGLSPFEITLKIWNFYSENIIGQSVADDIKSYVNRQTNKLNDAQPALIKLAAKLHQEQRSSLPEKNTKISSKLTIKLINRGLLAQRASEEIGFTSPLFHSYFAAQELDFSTCLQRLEQNYRWEPNHLTTQFNSLSNFKSENIDQIFRLNKDDPTRYFSILASGLTKIYPNNKTWGQRLLQLLAIEIFNDKLPFNVRIRVLSNLTFSGTSDLHHLFRKLLQSNDTYSLILGLIGSAIIQDIELIDRSEDFLNHEQPLVNQAVCLTLSKMENKKSFEKLTTGLLHASDSPKIIISETLALSVNDGQEILRDASDAENPSVRRAAVFGLSKIKEEWSKALLEKLSQDDREWIVRIAAADALSLSSQERWKNPIPFTEIEKQTWLVNFAAKNNIRVGTGQKTWNLVETALINGNQQQKLIALNLLNKAPYNAYNISRDLGNLLLETDLIINERVYNLLFSLKSLGISIKN